MFGDTTNYRDARDAMVEQQLVARGIEDSAVLTAMSLVPREEFVPEKQREHAYDDSPLAIGEEQTISQPYIVALMAEALELQPDDTVLEVGSGSGYAASVIAQIVRKVVGIEWHEVLHNRAKQLVSRLGYNNVELLHGDGSKGHPADAPYDAILVSAGAKTLPLDLLRQLRVGGRMVLPLGEESDRQFLIKITRTSDDSFKEEDLGAVRFVPLLTEITEKLH